MARMGFRIKQLKPTDPPDSFPDPATAGIALGAPEGLLAVGGDLSPQRLLHAYRNGIFPWYNDDQPILWWSPDPRAVIYPERFHMSRSLARELRRRDWRYSLNNAFADVIRGCAMNRGKYGTWLTGDMIDAYLEMHRLGYAHSVECWLDGELAGGIYGIRLDAVFFGESMFSSHTNGSKVAISALVQLCRDNDISLIDCQVESEHLRTLGMQEISRVDFLELLRARVDSAAACSEWHIPPADAAGLTALRNDCD